MSERGPVVGFLGTARKLFVFGRESEVPGLDASVRTASRRNIGCERQAKIAPQ